MKHRTDDEIEKAVFALRSRLGIYDHARPDMLTALATAKACGIIKDYARVEDCEVPGGEAQYNPDEDVILITNRCWRRGGQNQRTRFSIAHEFGHEDLDHTKTRDRSIYAKSQNWRPTSKVEDREESEANRFAAAFLCPFHLAEYTLEMRDSDLAVKFNVSLDVARIRLPVLEKMYRRKYGIPRPLPENVIDILKAIQGKGRKLEGLSRHEEVYGDTRTKNYEGVQCCNPRCRGFNLVRKGVNLICDDCHTIHGDD